MTNQSVTIRGPIVDTSTPDGMTTGSITSTGDITTNNGTVHAGSVTVSGDVTAGGSITSTGDITTNGSVKVVNGNVGIGTTGPSAKLEVDGQTYINNVGPPGVVGVNQLSLNQHGRNWGHFYGDSNNRLYFGASDALTTVPASPMMTWDLATDNVGIGTTTPGSKLDVVQANGTAIRALSGDSNSYTTLSIGRTADEGRIGVAAGAGQFANDAVAGDIILRTETTTPHLLFGNGPGNSTMAISNGSVGIGTTSPLGKLGVMSDDSTGVHAMSRGRGAGVVAVSQSGFGILAAGGILAGQFNGNVEITGNLNVTDTKSFKIDHPLDAAKKYLYHSSVESPDMKNIYDGVVVLDARGEAEVTLPAWFDALNTDFRYQLTPIGAPGPNLYIAEEISANRFNIAGGKPNMKVCWQVTGIRQDAWAKAHPLAVEEDKPVQEQGCYLHPELYGESDEKSIMRARYPEMTQPMQLGQQTKAES